MLRLFIVLAGFILPVGLSAQGIKEINTKELLRSYVMIQKELKAREISTSGNHLTGDLAEYLFVKAFGWERARRSQAGYDATEQRSAKRIQIKARRLSAASGNEQLGAIRKIESFDILAVILFDENYSVVTAALVPKGVVISHSKFSSYTNSYRFMFNDDVRVRDDVQDVTEKLTSLEY